MGGLGAWAGLGQAGANLPILSVMTEKGEQLADVGELTDRLKEYGQRFSDMKDKGEWGEEEGAGQGRKLRGLGVEPGQFRGDTLTDINSGLRVVATGIQIISTILTLLGAETTDRSENHLLNLIPHVSNDWSGTCQASRPRWPGRVMCWPGIML